MENNKRTISPISSEEEIKANVQQTPAVNTGREDSFTPAENQSSPEVLNESLIVENPKIDSAVTTQDREKKSGSTWLIRIVTYLLIVVSVGIVIAFVCFIGYIVYGVTSIKQSCETDAAKLEEYSSIVENKFYDNENYFMVDAQIAPDPTPACHHGNYIVVEGSQSMSRAYGSIEEGAQSVIDDMIKAGLPLLDRSTQPHSFTPDSGGQGLYIGQYEFSTNDTTTEISGLEFKAEFWLDDLEKTALIKK